MTRLKSRTELLDEVISNIETKGRCVSHDICVYWNEELGYGCAIGNFLKPEYRNNEFSDRHIESVGGLLDRKPDVLLPEYNHPDKFFLEFLQSFHDNSSYWVKDSITNKLRLTHAGILRKAYIEGYIVGQEISEEATN